MATGVTTTGGSDVNSNDILATVQYPDPSTGSPSSSYQETYTVDALAEILTYTDRAGNVHTYSFDILGRETTGAAKIGQVDDEGRGNQLEKSRHVVSATRPARRSTGCWAPTPCSSRRRTMSSHGPRPARGHRIPRQLRAFASP